MKKQTPLQYWVLKTEPHTFSIADLQHRKRERWDGVRNFQARNYLRAMAQGDVVFIYHSSITEPCIVGEAIITQSAYPDPLQFDKQSQYYDRRATKESPLWSAVTVAHHKTYRTPLSLKLLQQDTQLSKMVVATRGNRLSVSPVSAVHAARIRKLTQ